MARNQHQYVGIRNLVFSAEQYSGENIFKIASSLAYTKLTYIHIFPLRLDPYLEYVPCQKAMSRDGEIISALSFIFF
jgi:hypothetical protein